MSALAALPAQSVSSMRLAFVFGNRCAEPVRVDFGAVAVEAVYDDGRREPLEPVSAVRAAMTDGAALPLEPIAAAPETLSGVLDAYREGREILLFAPPSLTDKRPQQPVESVCADVSRLEVGSSEPRPPICFDRWGRPISAPSLAAVAPEPEPAPALPSSQDEAAFSDLPPRLTTNLDVWRLRPRLSLGFGLSTHHLALRRRSLTGGDSYGAPDTVAADPLGSAQAESLDVDFRWAVLGPLYVGAEAQFGGSSVAHQAMVSPGFVIDGGGFYGAGGLLFGVESPRIWQLTARAELFAGGWFSETHVAASPSPGDCSESACPEIAAWWLEPRVRVERWMTPWLSVGAWAGAGLLRSGDWSGGLALTAYGRSFDGL